MEANKMEIPEMITLEAYRNSIREYNKLKDKAEEFASKISSILYDEMFSIQGLETVDDDHIRIFGNLFWGSSEDYIEYTIPFEWFILSEEELVPAIDAWIHEYREAKKRKEEEERKKREEAWRQ